MILHKDVKTLARAIAMRLVDAILQQWEPTVFLPIGFDAEKRAFRLILHREDGVVGKALAQCVLTHCQIVILWRLTIAACDQRQLQMSVGDIAERSPGHQQKA